MALICIAIYDTDSNNRSHYTAQTLDSLLETVDFTRHRLFLSDNGSCQDTQDIYAYFQKKFSKSFPIENLTIRKNGRNLGTANAINWGWKTRREGEFCIKMDNDVVTEHKGWVDIMEECMLRQPLLSLIALKRRDLEESTTNANPEWKTKLYQLPHKRGERWLTVEQVDGWGGVFGTVQMYSPKLLDKIGYLFQSTVYGFDDIYSGIRCKLAKMSQAYVVGIDIDHIDTGVNPDGIKDEYIIWKQKHASEVMPEFGKIKEEFISGVRPIFFEPKWDEIA